MSDTEKIGPSLAKARLEQLALWSGYVEILRHEAWTLHHHRNLWRQMRTALEVASGDQTFFLDHYWVLYRNRPMSAIRRLVDANRDSVSVTRLLSELAEHPEMMTRAEHIKMWGIEDDEDDAWKLEEANKGFDRYADGDGDNVDPDAVRSDLGTWKADSLAIKKYVDKHIAHFDEKPNVPRAGEKDLDKAIDKVGPLVQKYTVLFTAVSMVLVEPTIQGDWKRPFRTALFPSFGD